MSRPLDMTPVYVAALLALGTTIARAQETPPGTASVYGEVLDVRVVNLEVIVTDKDGVAVRGLAADSFILEVDGQEAPIQFFSEVQNGVAALPADEVALESLPAVIPGEVVETSYLVFIDEFFSMRADRDKVLMAIQDDLPRLGPKDRMAVVAFDGRELEMLTTWEQKIPALERVLEKARERPTHGLKRLAEQRQFDYEQALQASFDIRTGSIDPDFFLRTDLTPTERFHLERMTDQILRAVSAATSTLRSFAMPPGRKVMLLLSGGWPFFPAVFLGPNISPVILNSDLETGTGLFRPLTDTANLLGYTVYPVDVPGFADTLSENRGTTSSGDLFGTRPVAAQPGRSSLLRQQEVHFTLEFLAQETGGRAMINAQRLDAFATAVSDTRSYYWLGFSPGRDWDDRRHTIAVRLKEPGFRVRSRSGYLDSSKQHEVAMVLESNLQFGSPAGVDSLQVIVGEPRKAGRKRMIVPLEVFVPLDEVTFLPGEQGPVANLELRVAVRDEAGRRSDVPIVPLRLERSQDEQSAVVGRFETSLKLRRLSHDAVVAVYDDASGRIFSANIEILPTIN